MIADTLLPEFDQEMAATRRVIERVPDDKPEWKPHPKSFAIAHLAKLLALMPGRIARTLTSTELDLAAGGGYSLENTDAVHRVKTTRIWLAAGLAVCAGGGCAFGGGSTYPEGAPAREAVDAPERFVSEDLPAGAAVTDTLPGTGCRSPLIDPRDGTRLRMVNSQQRVGDYAAPEGRYGVGPGELLRVECNTGRVVGIVPDRG